VKRRVYIDRRDWAASNKGTRGTWRCDMMPIEACVYYSRKIEEKEKSVNLPAGVAHLS